MGKIKLTAIFFYILLLSSNCVADEKLRAAFILPLSGSAALWGTQMRDGSMLAYDGLPAEIKSKLKIEFEDDAFVSQNTISAYRKIKGTSDLDFVVVFGSAAGEAIIPAVEHDKIPLVVATTLEGIAIDKSYVMRQWISSSKQAESVLSEVKKRQFSRLGVVVADYSAMLDVEKKFIEQLDQGLQIVAREALIPDITDFRTIIAKILSKKPEALFVVLLPAQTSTFMKQLRVINQEIPVFGSSTMENSAGVKAAAGAMEGVVYPGPKFDNAFVAEYEKRFNYSPELVAGNGFDLVKMLASAVEKGIFSQEELNTYLHTLNNFSGSLGTYGATDKNSFEVGPVMKVVKDGKFEVLP